MALSVFVTSRLFLSQIICVCHRQSLSVIDILCPSQTFCFFFVTDSLYLLQTVFVRHRKLCISQTVCVCPRHFFLSQIVCVCHRKFFACLFVSLSNTLLDHSWPDVYLFIHDFHQYLSVRF